MLTAQPLQPPLVACRLGQLYNKEAFIERWLHRKTAPLPSSMSHIDSRKDLKDLTVDFDTTSGKLVCPLSKAVFDSGVRGVFFWSCGCVVSTKALKRLSPDVSLDKPETSRTSSSHHAESSTQHDTVAVARADPASDDKQQQSSDTDHQREVEHRTSCFQRHCPVCSTPYDPQSDVVQLVPDMDVLITLKQKLLEAKQRRSAVKRAERHQCGTTAETGDNTVADVKKRKQNAFGSPLVYSS